jgi:integrator complex subunit 11
MISITPLGAGQEVGRSCILLRILHRSFLLDVGMHPAYLDDRRFPDLGCLCASASSSIDCVLVSHFHLDHVGALLHLTEKCGYTGPVYMSHPTKALCPSLLEDYNKVVAEQQAGGMSRTQVQQSISNAMKGVVGVGCRQRVCPFEDTAITAYYAGHVLGAVMFHVEVGGLSVFYTGDFNTQPQHHLGVADVPYLRVSRPPLPANPLLGDCAHPPVLNFSAAFCDHLRKHLRFTSAR